MHLTWLSVDGTILLKWFTIRKRITNDRVFMLSVATEVGIKSLLEHPGGKDSG